MDTKKLINEAKARFNHNSAKAYLKNKYQSKLIVADQGGLWTSTPELIAFLSSTQDTTSILLDSYNNPIKVDTTKLLIKLKETYRIVMEKWHDEFTSLEKIR
jgi:hypothetical protein